MAWILLHARRLSPKVGIPPLPDPSLGQSKKHSRPRSLTMAPHRMIQQSPRDARVSAYSGLPRLALPRERGRVVARHFRRSVVRVLTVVTADLAALAVVAWARGVLPWGHVVHLESPALGVLLGLILVGSYGRGEIWKAFTRVFAGVGLGVLAAGWVAVNEAPLFSAPFVVFVWLATASVISGERWLLGLVVDLLKRRLLSAERVLVVGVDQEALDKSHAQMASREGVSVVGRLTLTSDQDIWEVLTRMRPDTVVIAGELESLVFTNVVRATTLSGCYLLSVSRYDRLGGLRPRVVWWGGTPYTELSLPELTAPQLAVKRIVDVLGALVGLVLLSPLFLVLAVVIKVTSPGPVFFKQIRIGFGGGLFWMYKFRTMRADADGMKQSLAHLNASGDPRLFKIPDDPRVTKVGRLLRRWSLDEFPQLINVLKGEMSLVGPRPFFEDDLEDYREEHFSRLAAKPGITGLWQVRGRSSILDFEEVVRLDLEYVYRWSVLRDFLIILETIPAVLRRAGAV